MSEGQWVTPREFDAVNRRIDSLDGKVGDIHSDVKLLLAARNQEIGAHSERKELLEATRDKGARRIGWGALVAAALGAFWWIPDAIAKLHNG